MMFRLHVGRQALPHLTVRSPHIVRRRLGVHHFSTRYESQQLPPVRVLGPALWCITAVGTIYLGLAALEVRRDVKNFTKYAWKSSPATYDDLAAATPRKRVEPIPSYGSLHGTPMEIWTRIPETERFLFGNIAINSAIFIASSLPRSDLRFDYLSHMPIANRNFTMFTSMFGHASGMHLLFNMYCLYNFGPAVARAPAFQNSGYHLGAFYLSSGVLSSLVTQIEAKIPSRRFYSGLGASGAIMALIGIFGMSYPSAQIGIILLPGSIDAQSALGWIAAFETYGMIFGIPFLRWGHSVHLAGLAIGAAYAHFDGKGQIWDGSRRLAFNQMRRLNVV
ncbi:hypothetical protein TruAng_002935 [Truncatella angustata]|nr:hypothetical protein TruAng_002935 [Truncatella angustata]